jgi:hypothetical protein
VVGVINACLPFFPAVLRRVRDTTPYTAFSQLFKTNPTQLSKGTSSAMSSHNRKDAFQELDDDSTALTGIHITQDIHMQSFESTQQQTMGPLGTYGQAEVRSSR